MRERPTQIKYNACSDHHRLSLGLKKLEKNHVLQKGVLGSGEGMADEVGRARTEA